MKNKRKYYRFAEKGKQIQRVNRFFCNRISDFLWIAFCLCTGHPRAKGATFFGLCGICHLAVVSGGALLIGWKRRPESEPCADMGTDRVISSYHFFMTFVYSGVALSVFWAKNWLPFIYIGCIFVFLKNPKYSRIGG